MKKHHKKMANKNKSKNKSLFFFGVASLLWFIFRTGTKPSRIVYPCQRAALANSSMLLSISIPLSLTTALTKTKRFLSKKGATLALLIIVASVVISSEQFWDVARVWSNAPVNKSSEHVVTLDLKPHSAIDEGPVSDLFFVQNASGVEGNMDGALEALFTLMGSHGYSFYKTASNPSGLVGKGDVVIVKVNGQSPERGGTNTDLLKGLIQKIVDHPEGFDGEIVVADNAQFVSDWLDRARNNAYDIGQSFQDVVNMFSSSYRVSAFEWNTIRDIAVQEYEKGDMSDGYVVNQSADPNTSLYVSHPKFQTVYGTHISFKMGIWNATTGTYADNLKIINMPVLKSHYYAGVTAAIKHYMGVVSQSLRDNHYPLIQGGMGTEMAQTRFPTINLLDAIYVNANPHEAGWPPCGPPTPYADASYTNIIGASTDPVALDYWSSKYILMPAARDKGYEQISSMDPDLEQVNTDWPWSYMDSWHNILNRTMNQLKLAGYQSTMSEDEMSVYITSPFQVGPTADFFWTPTFPYIGEIVTFNASSSTAGSAPIVDYEWDFGDGNTTTTTNLTITHKYAVNKTYMVILNVTDSQGLWNTTSKTINVIPEFPTWTSILLTLILLAVAIAIYKRRLLKTVVVKKRKIDSHRRSRLNHSLFLC